MIFVEKYRPKEYEDVIGVDERITEHVNKDMPHFLFVGSPGTGKTTVAKIIINKLKSDFIILNASDERGIAVIRDKVKSFASTMSTNRKFKIVFLDEADKLTNDAMDTLRNLMETYHSNCRFILSGNYENKFTDAIQSRCVKIRFVEPNKEQIKVRLNYICSEEKIEIEPEAMNIIVERNYPDLRSMINKLQELSAYKRKITQDDVKKECKLVGQLVELMKSKKVFEARQFLLDNHVDYDALSNDMYDYVMTSEIAPTAKLILVRNLCEFQRYTNTVINKEMLFFEFVIKSIQVLQNA